MENYWELFGKCQKAGGISVFCLQDLECEACPEREDKGPLPHLMKRFCMEQVQPVHNGNCVYILKTGKNLFKIGKTQDLPRRLASYHTHLPVVFRIIRQYSASNMGDLEAGLHIVFQHKRVKGEWFELSDHDLQICDNIARNYALSPMQKQVKKQQEIHYSEQPLLQVLAANEKYLKDYSKIADDVSMGLSTEEIFALNEGTVSKSIIETVRRLLKYRTPNAEFLVNWLNVVNDLSTGMTEPAIMAKYEGGVSRNTIQMIKRILRNQLY